ncbi:MAG: glycosyltransferase [Ignavibacteriales bacterium]|nr:glycosyltransferase [Ignavibacteriales bacterium]
MKNTPTPAVALVHDWLTGMRGGEKVLEVLCELFPHATIFTLIHNRGSVSPLIERHSIRTSFLQHLPFVRTQYRKYLPLFPRAVESFDLTGFDLIISSSHAVAKGAVPPQGSRHLCYCHTPMRYVWDLYDDYFSKERSGFLTRTAMSLAAPALRSWDIRTNSRVHQFVANSNNVANRIQKYYGRSAAVIHAPVDTAAFPLSTDDEGYFLMVTALVPYKRVDLAINAFHRFRKKLIVVGKGPDHRRLASMAGPTIDFLGWQDDASLARLYGGCRALIFPGVEDFGIVPLEAMSCGKPVVAFAEGGALETVIDGVTGIFFNQQSPESLLQALEKLPTIRFDPPAIREHAKKFDRTVFRRKLSSFISDFAGLTTV